MAITAITPTRNTNTGLRPSLSSLLELWEGGSSFARFSPSISLLNISLKVFVWSRSDSKVLTYSDKTFLCEDKALIRPNAGHKAPARSAQTVSNDDSPLWLCSSDCWSRAFSISNESLACPVSCAFSQAWSAKDCVFCSQEHKNTDSAIIQIVYKSARYSLSGNQGEVAKP